MKLTRRLKIVLFLRIYNLIRFILLWGQNQDLIYSAGMLLSPTATPNLGLNAAAAAAACGMGVSNPRSGGGAMGVPLEACRVASYVSPLRLQSPLYDRIPGLPSLPLDPAIISAAHQVFRSHHSCSG